MEQRLDATYLKHDLVDRAAATALVVAGLGVGVLLAGWGVSLVWRYTPHEIEVRIKNPEVQITQSAPLMVKQETPFVVVAPDPLKIEQGKLTVKVEQPPNLPIGDSLGSNSRTAAGEVIKHEITSFSYVQHGQGSIVTGWNYKDGRGGTPVSQFCYYTSQNPDQSSKRVDLAVNGVRLPQISLNIVPDVEGALSKCRWWTE
jgi:hypothetical protein